MVYLFNADWEHAVVEADARLKADQIHEEGAK